MLPKSCHAPLQLHEPGVPLQQVAMDILGPLPETERGNRYFFCHPRLLYKVDRGCTYVKYGSTHMFAYNFVCRFGAPDYLHTDQGRNFESNLFSKICKLLGVSKTRTTPYHPQSDGLVERTLLNMLSIAAQDRECD